MIRFATIGTGWIAESFVKGTMLLNDKFCLSAVYSRTLEKGKEFADKFGCTTVITDIDELAQSSDIDAVYIASPNSLHFEQSEKMLENNKHVIVEKPACVTEEQYLKLVQLAQEKQLIYMEAIIPMHLPARKIIKAAIEKIGTIRSARFQFCQYSSKYQAFLEGKNPNIFNPFFCTGTLMDLGIYCVYPAIDLFDIPSTVSTQAVMLSGGADGSVSSIFGYGDKVITLIADKTSASEVPSEILGDKGSVRIGHISKYDEVILTVDGKQEQLVGTMSKEELMSYEALSFYRYITEYEEYEQEYKENSALSHKVCAVMESMRMQAGIKFPDKEEADFLKRILGDDQ